MRSLWSCFIWVLFFIPTWALAWSANGHKIVADIAYWHLTPTVRQQVNALTKKSFSGRPLARFEQAAAWPDSLKNQDVTMFNAWHFINLPIVRNGVTPPPLEQENVAWATKQMEQTVASSRATPKERAMALAFLAHFVGDAHQPLHDSDLYSRRFPPPAGDQGGNTYTIQSPLAANLHTYWDQGVGLFPNYQVTHRFVYTRQLASAFLKQFPARSLQKSVHDVNPYHWTRQGYRIAKQFAYTIPFDSKPQDAYIKQAQFDVKKQLVLAGLRLARILNQQLS